MAKPHKQKYLTNLLLGFASVSAGIFLILYAAFEKSTVTDWYFWAVIAAAMVCLGMFFLLTAFVHKIKADLIKRQKARDQQKVPSTDKDDFR